MWLVRGHPPNGSMVPIKTEVVTIRNRDKEIANEFSRLPSVRYTLMKPPAACSRHTVSCNPAIKHLLTLVKSPESKDT